MKQNLPLLCSHMADAVREYCYLIDHCDENNGGHYWISRMEKLLPRLHSAVLSLKAPSTYGFRYVFPDDDQRCELFMRLNQLLLNDDILWSHLDRMDIKHCMCECLADDFTDIYFDLKKGLALLHRNPRQPANAVANWQNSFYAHWGQHLIDAESWLHALEARNHHSVSTALKLFRTA